MRSCAVLLRAWCSPRLFSPTSLLLARGGGSSGGEASGQNVFAHTKAQKSNRSTTDKANSMNSNKSTLASFVPAIAATWLTASSNKMLQPHHLAPDSRKLAWWGCPSCQHQFTKRIDLHVAAGGECPKCHAFPSLQPLFGNKSSHGNSSRKSDSKVKKNSRGAATAPAIAHRCRPNSSQSSLTAENANRIKKSVADGSYLAHKDRRNLMPMLAKNYDKEGGKIGANEILAVSPKLDGIRCVTAFDAKQEKILFFSRAGTLFECCDAKIAPYLRVLFESDPTLVLDGELYNDSANLHRLKSALTAGAAGKQHQQAKGGKLGGVSSEVAIALGLLRDETQRVNPFFAQLASSTIHPRKPNLSNKGKHNSVEDGKDEDDEEVVSFEQLTSAIRATRDRRTAAHEALQHKLQYHVFDLLYAAEFPKDTSSPPFHVRYAYLADLLKRAHESNQKRFLPSAAKTRGSCLSSATPYDTRVLRLVPSLMCTQQSVDGLLRANMVVGYEGVMVRRFAVKAGTPLLLPSESPQAKKDEKKNAKGTAVADVVSDVQAAQSAVRSALTTKAAAKAGDGYGYGQRSSTLLKYKVMQDAEYIIVSAAEGKGKWKGCLGAFVCQTPDKKRTFTVTPASTDAQKKKMWATWQRNYKGKALTVQYQELTPDGIPRFPVGKSIRGSASGEDWI